MDEAQLQHALELIERADLLVIGAGASTALPSVRHFGQGLVSECGGRLLRINLRESKVPLADDLGLAMGALAAL
ncbi:hypothetical protein [Roseateles sp.]|jgi:hypothetical protein|uniref:hypothetical protein n=1 Tax=Roseateles sp. TaxID=1971397 RepID=UPI0037C5536B